MYADGDRLDRCLSIEAFLQSLNSLFHPFVALFSIVLSCGDLVCCYLLNRFRFCFSFLLIVGDILVVFRNDEAAGSSSFAVVVSGYSSSDSKVQWIRGSVEIGEKTGDPEAREYGPRFKRT